MSFLATTPREQRIHLEREIVVAVIRGILQVVAIGSLLVLLFRGPSWMSLLVLAAMFVTAASIAAGRVKKIPGAFGVALVGLGAGAGSVILEGFATVRGKLWGMAAISAPPEPCTPKGCPLPFTL